MATDGSSALIPALRRPQGLYGIADHRLKSEPAKVAGNPSALPGLTPSFVRKSARSATSERPESPVVRDNPHETRIFTGDFEGFFRR